MSWQLESVRRAVKSGNLPDLGRLAPLGRPWPQTSGGVYWTKGGLGTELSGWRDEQK